MSRVRKLLGRQWVQHLLVVLVGAALFLPNMGMALYDPWETHYAEVARQINQSGDWITLRWHADSNLADDVNRRCRRNPEECYFFSKPALIFWLMGVSLGVAGIDEAEALRLMDEDPDAVAAVLRNNDAAARFPITLIGLAGLFGIYWYIRRMMGRRAGLLAAAVTATTPFYYLLSRQIMTDIAFVVPMTVGLLCLAYWLHWPRVARARHLYLFYALAGVATLAKGLLGFLLPGAIMLAFLLLRPGEMLSQLRRLRLLRGAAVFLTVAAPWYAAVWAINGRTWYDEFIHKHHFRRVGEGVHGERGHFEYFVEQLGFGLWPWVALVPLALGGAWLVTQRRDEKVARLRSLLLVWSIVSFALFTISTTKFHHYVFPAVPPMAILVGMTLSRILEAGKLRVAEKALMLLGIGVLVVVTPILFTEPFRFINLFIYGYVRQYPYIDGTYFWLASATAIFALGLVLLFARPAMKLAPLLLCLGGLVGAAWNIHGFLVGHQDTLAQRNAHEAYYRNRQDGDRLYSWALRWRGEVWYSFDEIHEIPQHSEGAMRRELNRPGRAFVATIRTTRINGRLSRLFGRTADTLNDNPVRYSMVLWPGPPEGRAEQHIVDRVPAGATKVNASLGDDIELLAYEMEPPVIAREKTVRVTLYFQAKRRVREDWTVFVHGDYTQRNRRRNRMVNDHIPAHGLLPTNRWRKGQIIRDRVEVEAGRRQRPGSYQFYTGLFSDDERAPVSAEHNDGRNRIKLGAVEVRR